MARKDENKARRQLSRIFKSVIATTAGLHESYFASDSVSTDVEKARAHGAYHAAKAILDEMHNIIGLE